MQVKMYVNFNGKEVLTTGYVLEDHSNSYLVQFFHEGVEYRGMWDKSKITKTIL